MKIKATIVLGMFGLATVLSACGGNEEEMATYCVDAAGMVVDEDYCDPDHDLFNATYLLWYSDDDHKYKKGKKIPSADFRKGTTTAPSAKPPSKGELPKPSVSKSSTGSKPSANAPKPQAPKPQAPKPPAPKPAGSKK